jgi:hypothetical protein
MVWARDPMASNEGHAASPVVRHFDEKQYTLGTIRTDQFRSSEAKL